MSVPALPLYEGQPYLLSRALVHVIVEYLGLFNVHVYTNKRELVALQSMHSIKNTARSEYEHFGAISGIASSHKISSLYSLYHLHYFSMKANARMPQDLQLEIFNSLWI